MLMRLFINILNELSVFIFSTMCGDGGGGENLFGCHPDVTCVF